MKVHGFIAALFLVGVSGAGCESKAEKKGVSERFEESKLEAQKAVDEAKRAVEQAKKEEVEPPQEQPAEPVDPSTKDPVKAPADNGLSP